MPLPSPIRRAVPAESTLLTELGVRAKAFWGYSDEVMETFRQELTLTPEQIELADVFVVAVAEELVGYYALQPLDRTLVELQHLFVEPRHFGYGHGSRLLEHAISQAKHAGYGRMAIQSDPNAAGFYQKHNIRLVKEISSSIPGRSIPYFEIDL